MYSCGVGTKMTSGARSAWAWAAPGANKAIDEHGKG